MATLVQSTKVVIVGGGNAGHALAALLPHKGFPTTMYCPFEDEAERMRAGIAEQGHVIARFASHNDPAGDITGAPLKISKDPAEVIPQADVIIMPLPSFAYIPVLEDIKAHLQPGQRICVTPGQGGFDWIAHEVLGHELFKQLTFYAVMPMPFNCRVQEFGKLVPVQEFKRRYRVGCVPGSEIDSVVELNAAMFGHTEPCGLFLACSLYPINAVLHPSRLFSLLRDWTRSREPLKENPFFYEEMTPQCTAKMDEVNAELLKVVERWAGAGLQLNVPHIFDFLARYVYSDEAPTLCDFFTKQPAYKGFRCPLSPHHESKGWVPDFRNRYFTEDIPMGLCLYKGVADIVGVETPKIDEIILWAQEHMGKEYVREGKLAGDHAAETTAPQRFGIRSLEELRARYS